MINRVVVFTGQLGTPLCNFFFCLKKKILQMMIFLIKQCYAAILGDFAMDKKVVLSRFAELCGQRLTGNEFSETT